MGLEHSKVFGLSGAPRWANCNGAPKLCADEPDIDSEVSREGTAAHWVAEQMLETFKLGGDGLPIGKLLIGRKAPNGMVITDEMFDGALTYYNVIVNVVGWAGQNRSNLHIEARVTAHHTLDPEAWGTADAIYFDAKNNILYIWDFKFGHLSVVAYDNLQLVAYAIATGETFKYTKLNPRLHLTIIQPRCYDGQGPVREWITTYDDLRAHVNKLKSAIIAHRMNKGMVTSGAWCRECPAGHKCPAIRQAAAIAIDFSTTAIPLDMSNDALAYELEIIERAEDRIKQRKAAVTTEAETRVRAGQLVPGRRMQDTVGNRAWSVPDAEVYQLGLSVGINLKSESKPVTVAAAEKMLKAKAIDASVISKYHHKPKTGVKLVFDDGSRAKQIFSQEKI